MRTGGLLLIARHFVGWLVRGAGLAAAHAGRGAASACFALADRIDPPAPTSVEPPPEWKPRLWDRTGGRAATEARD